MPKKFQAPGMPMVCGMPINLVCRYAVKWWYADIPMVCRYIASGQSVKLQVAKKNPKEKLTSEN